MVDISTIFLYNITISVIGIVWYIKGDDSNE